MKKRADFLMSAFDCEDVFDFSNPEDATKFAKLYRRAR